MNSTESNNIGAQCDFRALKCAHVDYNEIRQGSVVALIERASGAQIGERVLTYDGDEPHDKDCNRCEGDVFAIQRRLVRIRLDWETWQ